jgi:hypothetical protein
MGDNFFKAGHSANRSKLREKTRFGANTKATRVNQFTSGLLHFIDAD